MIDLLKALADENRMRIINMLMQEELCVCELETVLSISQSNASRHLNKLKQAGVIESSKEAQWVHYKVSPTFKSEHSKLYDYLVEQVNVIKVFADDTRRLRKYFDLGLNCTDIREDASRVIQLISIE